MTWQLDYSVMALVRAFATYPPYSIRIYHTASPDLFRWEFSYPSALRVIAVLSPSQSLMMATGIASTSETHPMPAIGFGTQLRFWEGAE